MKIDQLHISSALLMALQTSLIDHPRFIRIESMSNIILQNPYYISPIVVRAVCFPDFVCMIIQACSLVNLIKKF